MSTSTRCIFMRSEATPGSWALNADGRAKYVRSSQPSISRFSRHHLSGMKKKHMPSPLNFFMCLWVDTTCIQAIDFFGGLGGLSSHQHGVMNPMNGTVILLCTN
jgi:hypothetical protein